MVVHDHFKTTNPYREGTTKHKKWISLINYVHTLDGIRTCVYDVVHNTLFSASDLWKEARHNHVTIRLISSSCSVLTYFDNLRAQWASVDVLYGDSETIVTTIENSPLDAPITLYDICNHIEKTTTLEWLPESTQASEWSFLLYSSQTHQLLNPTADMSHEWWSMRRFAHHICDYSTKLSIRVYPCVFDKDIKCDMGIINNRLVIPQPDTSFPHASELHTENHTAQTSQTPIHHESSNTLRQEQDAAYYASLVADQKKNQMACIKESPRNPNTQKVVIDDASVEKTNVIDSEEPTDKPLSREEIRKMRCAFYQQ